MMMPLQRLPLYEQAKQRLTQRIAAGEWQEAEPLPSEWELASELALSQGTVRKALLALTQEGWLYREQGRGTFVAPPVSDWGSGPLLTPGLFTELAEKLAQEFLGISRCNASDDVAAVLELRRAAPLLRVRQLWRWQASVVAVDEILLPAERFEGLDARSLRHSAGVYATLALRFGVRLRIAHEQFRAMMLPREESALLGITGMVSSVPVLSMLRLSVAMDNTPLEWRQRYCLTDRLALTLQYP